jgi:hypothetical protein
MPAFSANESRSSDVERVIDEWLDLLDELDGVRQPRMNLEGSFVSPLRMDVEESVVARGAKSVDLDATRFLTGRTQNIP